MDTIAIQDAPLNSIVKDDAGTHFSITERLFGIDAEGFGADFSELPYEQVTVVATDVYNWEEIRSQYK